MKFIKLRLINQHKKLSSNKDMTSLAHKGILPEHNISNDEYQQLLPHTANNNNCCLIIDTWRKQWRQLALAA